MPRRQGVHWPHDSSTKNSIRLWATASMSRCGPMTMTEPPVGTSSKDKPTRELRARHASPGSAPDLRGLGVLASHFLQQFADGDAERELVDPGRAQSPETLNSLRPVELGVPELANHSAPLVKMQATQARVSTLFTTEGR